MDLIVDGIDFGEGPGWHDGELWYSDFHQRAIYAVTADGARRTVHGGLPDHLEGAAKPAGAMLARIAPDGAVSVAAEDLRFPNGSVITPDGATRIVGQTMGANYVAFTIEADGALGDRRVWAETPNMFPDGCCLDAGGGVWFADALGSQVVRVTEGGEITHRLPTPMPTYACMLGGPDETTLYALCAPSSMTHETAGKAGGAITRCRSTSPAPACLSPGGTRRA